MPRSVHRRPGPDGPQAVRPRFFACPELFPPHSSPSGRPSWPLVHPPLNFQNYPPTAMARSPALAGLFRQPTLTAQLHYEICKAYFRDEDTAEQIALRFSLQPDSVRSIVNDFAKSPDLARFFLVKKPGPVAAPKRAARHQAVIDLRRQGLGLAQIKEHLGDEHPISESSIYRILHQ